jgi:endonuclease/exonuclease/phosphatase (EEP) superfamily protein YafD
MHETIPTADAPRTRSFLMRVLSFFAGLYVLALWGYIALRFAQTQNILTDTLTGLGRFVGLAHTGALYLFLPALVIFVLALIARWRRIAGMAFLALVVGALWFAPRFLPRTIVPPPETATTFSLLSFNAYPDNEQIDDVVAYLRTSGADIIALQEAGSVLPLLENLEDLYPHQAIDDDNAILSRFPFDEDYADKARTFDLTPDDIPYATGAQQRAYVTIDEQTIALYNVHLTMPVALTDPDEILPMSALLMRYDESTRNQQIRTLLALTQTEDMPVIIAGDFNMSSTSLIYDDIRALYGDAYANVRNDWGATYPAGRGEELPDIFPPLLRLDYVWHEASLRATSAQVGTRLGSDHLPVMVEMVLSP